MVRKPDSQKDPHTHLRSKEFREACLGPDNKVLAKLYEEAGKEFPSGIPKQFEH